MSITDKIIALHYLRDSLVEESIISLLRAGVNFGRFKIRHLDGSDEISVLVDNKVAASVITIWPDTDNWDGKSPLAILFRLIYFTPWEHLNR